MSPKWTFYLSTLPFPHQPIYVRLLNESLKTSSILLLTNLQPIFIAYRLKFKLLGLESKAFHLINRNASTQAFVLGANEIHRHLGSFREFDLYSSIFQTFLGVTHNTKYILYCDPACMYMCVYMYIYM